MPKSEPKYAFEGAAEKSYVTYFHVKRFTHNLYFLILYKTEHTYFERTLKKLVTPITLRNFDAATRLMNCCSYSAL